MWPILSFVLLLKNKLLISSFCFVPALLSSATANGFQMVVSGAQSKALPDFQITNIQGRLSGHGIEEQLQTIVITAHYDATGVAPVSL